MSDTLMIKKKIWYFQGISSNVAWNNHFSFFCSKVNWIEAIETIYEMVDIKKKVLIFVYATFFGIKFQINLLKM